MADTSGAQIEALRVLAVVTEQRNAALDHAARMQALAEQRGAEINDLRAQLADREKEA